MNRRIYFAFFILIFVFFYPIIKITTFLSPIFIKIKNKKGVLYLDSFPFNKSSGHKYRVKTWIEILQEKKIPSKAITHVKNAQKFFKLIEPEHLSYFISIALVKRFFQLFKCYHYQTIIVRRELLLFNDYGKLFMDKLLVKMHPNVILDFDDDIAAAKKQPKRITSFLGKLLLEDGNKFNNSLRLYNKFIVASEYLKEKVLDENKNIVENEVIVIPTCVDYNKYPIKKYPDKSEKISFGWIGGNHNYFLLEKLIPIFNTIADKYSFKLIIIGGKEFKKECNFETEFIPWSIETEINSLYKIDIGLMPLENNEISKGKGGFKLIQYMGLGIVSVASAVTINCEIIEHGVNSFLIFDDNEWGKVFVKILENKVDLKAMGYNARKQIEQKYTFDANKDKYLKFVTSI